MLSTGIRAGTIPDYLMLNKFARTAEQMSNINIIAHIKALSDNQKTDTSNTIYFTQLRDRIMLLSIYISVAPLSSINYPVLGDIKDENGNVLTTDFTHISNQTETFNINIDENDYILTFVKASYSVAPASIGKRVQAIVNPISTAKDFDDTYLNSLLVLQLDSVKEEIAMLQDGGLSSSVWLNKIKTALNKNFSYSLAVFDIAGNKTRSDNTFEYINNYNDLYEIGGLNGYQSYISMFDDVGSAFLIGTLTTGTNFDYTNIEQSTANFNKTKGLNSARLMGETYLTTTDTLSFSISSSTNAPLNSYDLIQIRNDIANRLQGRLYYPVIGVSLLTEGNAGSPVNADLIFKNNIDSINFNYSVELISGYRLRFAVK